VWIIASVSCCQLTEVAPVVVFCCCSPSSSGFDVLCVQRWCSAFFGWNECLFALLLPSYHLEPVCPFSSDLSHQQGIFVHTTDAHWIFSVFRTILCKRWLCVKIPEDQRFLTYSDQPAWHQQPCHVQCHLNPFFFPNLILGLNFSKLSWPPLHAWMHWVAAMRPHRRYTRDASVMSLAGLRTLVSFKCRDPGRHGLEWRKGSQSK